MNQSIPTGQIPRLRRLKVYERTLLYGSGGSFSYRVVCNPEIRLCGQWLNQMGFTSALSIIDTCLAQLLIRNATNSAKARKNDIMKPEQSYTSHILAIYQSYTCHMPAMV